MDFHIKEAEHQRPGVRRLDVQVVEPYVRYPAVALVLPTGEIQMALKSRCLPDWATFQTAVRAYLEEERRA